MTAKPGDYALGSLESRTAARTMLERIQTDRKKNVVDVIVECIGNEEANRTFEVYWPNSDGNR
jgi:hypothetical protein